MKRQFNAAARLFAVGGAFSIGAFGNPLPIVSVIGTGAWTSADCVSSTYACNGAIDGISDDSVPNGGFASYWLGREGTPNETLTFDLGGVFGIAGFNLYNTHNDGPDDRWTNGFEIWVSTLAPNTPDNNPATSFGTLVIDSTLAHFPGEYPNTQQSFSISALDGRYVTFRATDVAGSWPGNLTSGLSEFRVVGTPEPGTVWLVLTAKGCLAFVRLRRRRADRN